jgi:hypothetical protein
LIRGGTAFGTRLAACVGAAIAAGLCGCAIIGERYVMEMQFTESQAQRIRNGETTKKEILEWLGPPAAIARPASGAADNVLRRFAATIGSGSGQVAYRYQTSALTWGNLCAYGQGGGGCIPSTPLLNERKLWLLIDERTGRVVDHFVEETVREETGADIRPWPGP